MKASFNLSTFGTRTARCSTSWPRPGTLYVFDDFEGTEKGVINVATLRPAMPQYILIEPCPVTVLLRYGIQGRRLAAPFVNIQKLSLTRQ